METIVVHSYGLNFISFKSKEIGDWNRKHKKSKTISWRVYVFENLTEMDIFSFKSAAINAVYQIFHLIDQFYLEIVEKSKLKFVRMPERMKSSYLG